MRRLLVVSLVALACVPAAAAQPLLGLYGSIDRFHGMTGQQSSVGHVIVGWGQPSVNQLWQALGPTPMLGFDAGAYGREAITPLAIARGRGDGFLIALNASASLLGRPVYVRPLGEMNGHWNPYCAYNKDGTSRGAAHATAAFRKAFARIYLLLHGGSHARIDARLRRLGLPPVGRDLPVAKVKVVWNPQGYGSPDIPGNSARSYYPGDSFVDVVGDDLYDIGGKAEWPAAEALYRAHPSKPFAFPEWGLWGIDDPTFVRRMARFIRTHRRTELVAYFNAKPGSLFDLESKPRSLAAYRRLIVPLGR